MVTSAPGCLLVGDDRIRGKTLTECEAPQADAFMRDLLSLVLEVYEHVLGFILFSLLDFDTNRCVNFFLLY